MAIDALALKAFIHQELATISDPRVVAHIRGMLVEPYLLPRDWDYGDPGQQYPCWIVLHDREGSNAEIGYCEFGFGPRCPWGLVSSADGPQSSMGMDSGWFATFLDAFFESFACVALPIWQVYQEMPDRSHAVLTEPGGWNETWQYVAELQRGDPNGRYHAHHAVIYGDHQTFGW